MAPARMPAFVSIACGEGIASRNLYRSNRLSDIGNKKTAPEHQGG
jgi:hypothetical protein